MDTATCVQIPDEAVCISYSNNTFGLDRVWIHLFCLHQWVKMKDNRIPVAFVWRPILEKKNSEYKPVKLHLKIDLVFYSARLKGKVNIGSARGVMVIVVGIGHGDTSSNPRRDWLHITLH